MEEAAAVHFLRDAFILLGFALGFVLLFRRFGLGATLGYLVAEEIGKGMGMQQMAKLECGAARTAVVAAVEKLRKLHATQAR